MWDVQSLIYKALGEMDMSGIKYLLERKPQIYYGLVVNFVSERYFNFKLGQANLDEPVDGINGYYYQKIHDFYSGFRKKQNGHQR